MSEPSDLVQGSLDLLILNGAQPSALLRSVPRQGLTLTLVGVVSGTAAAFALTRTLASLLFEVSATDPTVFFSVPLLLVAVALRYE